MTTRRPLVLPPGATLLTADEAVEAVVTNDHPEAVLGSVQMDAGLVTLLRSGQVLAVRLADGRLGFALAPPPN